MTTSVCFVDWSHSTVRTAEDLSGPLCGRITCLKAVTAYLAEAGWDVRVLIPVPEPFTVDGVTWSPEPPTEALRALVFVRGMGNGLPGIRAERRYLWVRDLPHGGFIPEPQTAKALAGVVYLSEYARRVWRAFYPLLPKGEVIPNGVDPSIFHRGFLRHDRRHDGGLIHVAHPVRGLHYLPGIWKRIKSEVPDAKLTVYSDAAALHPGEGGDYEAAYAACREAGITLSPLVTQDRLAEVMRGARASLFPTVYPEICSNTVLQTLACGCPIITTGSLGATQEWVEDGRNGYLSRWLPMDGHVYQEEIARAAVRVLRDEKWAKKLRHGAKKTAVLPWWKVGYRWHRLMC